MKQKPVLIWINCYGAWAPDLRRPIESAGYDQYLDAAVEKISNLKGQIRDIWISGGMLDVKGRTECETTRPELEKRLKKAGIDIEIKTDEESVTSMSIVRKFLETWREKYADCRPSLFIDEVRYITNEFVFESFCKELGIDLKASDVLVPLPRPDDHPHSTPEFQRAKLEVMKAKGIEWMIAKEKEERKKLIKH